MIHSAIQEGKVPFPFGYMQFQVGCQGDFFVVDHGSAVRFDETMTLKELWFRWRLSQSDMMP